MQRRESSVPRGVYHITPVFIARSEGAVVEDVDGNHFLDFAGGLGCLNVGHRAPAVVEAIRAQTDRYLHGCMHVTPYDGYVRLAEALNARTPGSWAKKTLLVNTGAEGVENAVKIARAHTGRPAVLAFEHAFHGRTLLTMTLTGKTHPYKVGFGPFAPEIYRAPYAYCYRCPYSLTYPSCEVACGHKIEDIFRTTVEADKLAAVIVEPMLGEGGFVPPPREFFQILTDICRPRGILLIADEVQSGFGRTGTLFACEQFGFEPDLLVAAKSLAGGLPLASVTGRAEIMDTPVVGGLGGTYGGNPLACEAALAVLKTFDSEDLGKQAHCIGDLIEKATRPWHDQFPLVGDIRGLGAMRAIELVRNRETKEPAKEETQAIISACHQRGLIILPAGTYGNVIRVLVPLVATEEQVKEGLSVLEAALQQVSTATTTKPATSKVS
jgi:4-aminobutyrate aminotransferase/(S)-3-amino-2-methylpropionate transaminase